MKPSVPKGREFIKEAALLKGKITRLPLVVTLIFFATTFAWILFEHAFLLPWSAVSKDIFWAVLSTIVLFLLMRYGVAVIRRSETALQESERHLSRILETSASGIIVVDRNGFFSYANTEASSLLGMKRSDLVGRHYTKRPWEITKVDGAPYPPDELPFSRVAKTGEALYGVELAVRRQDGSRVVLSANTAPLPDSDGGIAGMIASFFDITARREAEELHLRKLFLAAEQSPTAVAITGPGGRIEYVNPALARMTGFPREALLDEVKPCPTEISPEACRQICDAIAAGAEWKGEYRNRRRDGELYWESAALTPIRTAEGAVANFLWVAQDVTEQRMADEALKRSEERFRQIFEQNEEPVFLFRSGTAEIIDANPAAVVLYGFSVEEMRTGGPSLFVGPGEQFRFEQEIRGIVPGTVLSVDQAWHVRKDGSPIIVSIRGKSIEMAEERVSYCTFRDITARVRAEEEARDRQAQLIHANRMTSLGTMVSGVAHEINNPNNLIMFNAPMIRAAWKDADKVLEEYFRKQGDFSLGGLPYSEMCKVVPKLLDGVSDSSVRIRAIVEKLKNFARRDRENLECRIDLNEVVRASAAILDHEIVKGCRDFRVDLEESLPMVKGCAQQLEQVMVNLLTNALQALPDRTRGIQVSTRVNGDAGMVEVRVRDEGVGISAEVKKRLCEPFFSTKHEVGGLGLGLSISASIIQDHNGTLNFTSEVGKGTVARILLPPFDPAGEGFPKVSVPKYSR